MKDDVSGSRDGRLPLRDVDRDSLHILPLSILPIETPALRHARLIKNVRLRSMVELFVDPASGSGQLDVEDLPHEFKWELNPPHPDLVLLRRLALLSSYDVYSLRISLREHGITVTDVDALKLSEAKNRELTEYMTRFTHPLIVQIYGDEDMDIDSFEGLVALFRDPDVKKALDKLKVMASKLDIGLAEVPKFLEDYGDIFLSLSYYRHCLDEIEPIIGDFLASFRDMRHSWEISHDRNLLKAMALIETTFSHLTTAVSGRFRAFDRSTQDMWNDISAERFREVETLIAGYHTTIGGALCALSVKMHAWHRLFPTRDSGGPARRAEFIMSEIRQGLENIQKIEDTDPPPADPG